MKNKNIRIVAIALITSSFMFVSCDKNSKKAVDNVGETTEIVEVEVETSTDGDNELDVEEREIEKEIRTRTYKMKDGTNIVYNFDTKGIVGFDDWSDYTVVNAELEGFRRAKYVTTPDRVKNLNYRIANLGNTIPTWLKTEEVMEDVADIQKEYLELIKEGDASEKEMRENLEELSEKFDDLKEELDETVAEYTKIHEDAIEEYNEEIKKGKIEAAIEEYNEEIKKMDKIVKKKQ